jgi:TonB-linked SusC/RagA family outer membrane protein
MKKKIYLFLVLFATLLGVKAQDVKVTGTVTDEATGKPVEAATISVKGSKKAVASNSNGDFVIKVNTGATLVISSVGYAKKEVEALAGGMRVSLIQEKNNLADVVVVGYGTQKRAAVSGAITSLKTEDITKRQVASTSNLLQGLAPGVTVQQQSGKPGADGASIVIRGQSSITGSNAPLVIIDGLAAGSLDQIDPNTIESITVLKDAASAAIYGNRASGGVILVKTKRGTKKGIAVSYNNFFTKQQATAIPKRVSALEHLELTNTAALNLNPGLATLPVPQTLIDRYKNNAPNNFDVIDTDWLDLLLTNSGFMQNHNVQISSGGEKVNMFTSVTYLKQQGLIQNNSYEKYDVRFNPEFKLSDKFTLSGNFALTNNKTINPSTGSAEFIIRQAIGLPATAGGKYGDLYGTAGQSNLRNPIAMAEAAGTSVNEGNTLFTKFGFNYRPISGLEIEGFWGRTQSTPTTKTFVKNVDIYQPNLATQNYDKAGIWPGNTSLGISNSNNTYQTYLGQASYGFKYKDHSFKILAGVQSELYKNFFFGASRQGFINPNQPYLNQGSGVRDNNDGASENSLVGVFTRANYNFKEKYFLELNGRRDGSSRFSQLNDKQWGTFGSASVGWIFSKENFFRSLSNVISFGKLRASIGGNGNQNVGSNYAFDAFYGTAGYTASSINGTNAYFNNATTLGVALLQFPNPDLLWETSRQQNIGLDLSFKNGFTISGDMYVKTLKNQLLQRTLPPSAGGLGNPIINAGNMENKGWELSLNYKKKIKKFGIDATFLLSDVKNNVVSLVDGLPFVGDGIRSLPGSALQSYFGYQAVGYFSDSNDIKNSPVQFGSPWNPANLNSTKPGDVKYADLNDDKKVDALDREILGNSFPRYEYSINLNLTYANFDLNIFGQGVGQRNNYLTGTGAVPFNSSDFIASLLDIHKDSWSPTNTNATFPRLLPAGSGANNYVLSSKWIRSASYFRIKNVNLGYRIPTSILSKKIKVSSIRVYGSAANLFTITKAWKGFDPEINTANAEFYPLMRTYTFGVNVNF